MIRCHRFSVLLLLVMIACSSGQENAVEVPQLDGTVAEMLTAIGYAEWSEAGDSSATGVTRHAPDKVNPGFNLFESRRRRVAQLMDMEGAILHQWESSKSERAEAKDPSKLKGSNWHGLHVFPNGDLIGVMKNRYLERLDWDSNLLWRTPLKVHHDVSSGSDGRIYTLTDRSEVLELPNGTQVRVIDNEVAILDGRDGEVIEKISLLPIVLSLIPPERITALKEIEDRWLFPLDTKEQRRLDNDTRDLLHTNSVEVVERDIPGVARAGNLLLSIRELNLVAILDLEQKEIVWSWGPGEVYRQHHPTILANDNMMIFDNQGGEGRVRASRIVELDPRTKTIEWEYIADPPTSFFSEFRGSSYLMPNDNVLITESGRGRAFEVTRAGETVWEYINPETRHHGTKRATFYRFDRLPLDYFDPGVLMTSPPTSELPRLPNSLDKGL